MTRQDHLAWCKQRALEYCDRGELREGLLSMLSDLNKHEETRNHPASMMAALFIAQGKMNTSDEVRRFIEGFN